MLAAAACTANSLISDHALRFRNAQGEPLTLSRDLLLRVAQELQVKLGETGDPSPALQRQSAATLKMTAALSVGRNRAGDVLRTQGNLAGALDSYRKGLAIAEKLAAADPANTGWQRDLSVSYQKVGDVLNAQDNFAGALDSHRSSLPIREELVAADPSNTEWQRDLSVSYWNLAAAGDDPCGNYGKALAILKKLKAEGRLAPADEQYIATLESLIADLPPGG